MSYNGSGTFVVNSSGQPVVTGTVISSTAFNALTADLATGLSTAITKDGQTTTTSRILFAQGISSTLVTDATSATTGSIITAGGISCQKAAVVGTLLGVGMAPVNVLDITQNQNASSAVSILNSSAGASATADLKVNNGTSAAALRQNGASYTTSGAFRADGTLIYGTGAGGISIITQPAQPIYFGINNAQKGAFNASGYFKADVSGGTGGAFTASDHRIISNNLVRGNGILYVYEQTGSTSLGVTVADAYAANTAISAVQAGKDTATGRSINAGGTINASGADYAEYMTKAENCGVIAKGAIAGVDANGKLTDNFSDAHSFVVKSTDPSYVGGDAWGSYEALGFEDIDKEDPEFNQKETVIATALEIARQKVDRIAFSGQVPVNVTGATVGDYIVPVAGPDGGIAGEAVTNPTFDQYRAAVGRVWKILEDGRAFVSVKVS